MTLYRRVYLERKKKKPWKDHFQSSYVFFWMYEFQYFFEIPGVYFIASPQVLTCP
jgi:hypothetical protein